MTSFLNKYINEPLYRNSIAMMLNSSISAFFGFIFWIVAARIMSSNDIGLATSTISAATLILAISKLGMDQGLIRYLPESKNKTLLCNTILITTLFTTFTLTIVFIIGIELISPALLFIKEGWFLLIFFIYITIMSLFTIQNIILIAIRRADVLLILNLLIGLRIPLLISVAFFGVMGIFFSITIATIISFILGVFLLNRYGFPISLNIDINILKNILKFSLGNYFANIFSVAPITIIPLLILNTIGAKESAYFYIAYSVSSLLITIPNSVSMSLFVEGSYSLSLKEKVFKSIKFIILLLVPALVIIFIFGNKILLLFNKEYSIESFEILKLLGLSSIFSSVISIYISIKKIQKDIKMINYISFVLSSLVIILGYITLLEYGLIGIGYAWLVANILVCIFVIGIVLKKIRPFNN